MHVRLIEPWGVYASLLFLLASWIFFFWQSGHILASLFVALLGAALFWISWVIVRLVILTFKE